MSRRLRGVSPRVRARVAGLFYLANFVTGGVAMALAQRSPVASSAVVLLAAASYVVVTLLLYGLFRPVSSSVSLVAALVSLLGCVISALSAFDAAPVQVSPLVFFGVYCLLIGYLILRSTFLPRILGVLMAFAGLSWLTFVSAPLAKALAPYNFLPGLVGEGALTVWLLAVGLNAARWMDQAGDKAIADHYQTAPQLGGGGQ